MGSYLKSLWLFPAGVFLMAFLVGLLVVFSIAAGLTALYVTASQMFNLMFWLLPLSGLITVVVLLAAFAGRVRNTSRQMTRRAIAFSAIVILSPLALGLLKGIVSGFTR